MKAMPALFAGHGNPMLTLGDNHYTRGWSALGAALPQPRAVLAISAHWYVPGTRVTAMAHPRTIHDFGGFPEELYRITYPAPGEPQLARQVAGLLAPAEVALDEEWGLDHGTWSVLRHLFPKAELPVLQLSIDRRLSPREHYELGRRLAALRQEGVMIFGSGNLVHNLAGYDWRSPAAAAPAWAEAFDEQVVRRLERGEDEALIDYHALTGGAFRAVPTPEHYLPLLYLCALRQPEEKVTFPITGFDGGSMSMRCVQFS